MYWIQLYDQQRNKELQELTVDRQKQHHACRAYLEHLHIDEEDVGGYKSPYHRYYWKMTQEVAYPDSAIADI